MSVLSESIKTRIRELMPSYPTKQAITLPALHMVQEQYQFVSPEAVVEIAEILELAPAQVQDTLSFYGFFSSADNPSGKRRIWICRSLSCMLRGSEDLINDVCEQLHVTPGGRTADGTATIEIAECLGACDGAPCILVNDELRLNVASEEVVAIARGDQS